MQSWLAFPDAPLSAAGSCSTALLRAGCSTIRDSARFLCELPYGRNTNRADYRLVLPEQRGTCSTKHALLAAAARECDLPLSLTIGIYDMTEANTPGVGRVLRANSLSAIPEAHCYLTYQGQRLDITRSDVTPRASMGPFHREWPIEPSQIGEYKVRLHQEYLREWLADHPELRLGPEEIWRIREQCILSLSTA